MKKAVIFDMDGVLIDSEPLWQQAQIDALAVFGVSISREQCETLTMGKRIDEIAKTWISLFTIGTQPETLQAMILNRLCQSISQQGEAMTGVYNALAYFESKNITLALATSSNHLVIKAVFDRLQLWDKFSAICSAEDEQFGKPHPDVYLTAMKKLNVLPSECIVIEDSFTGLSAAKSAGIQTCLVSQWHDDKKFASADFHCPCLNAMLTQFALSASFT